jgi:flavin reductase (DIM6/NTAB) family NADH-FMN oxidoreductase RutF
MTGVLTPRLMLRPYERDPEALRRAFSGFPSGIAALAAVVGEEPAVLIASSFTVGVSQDPPLVLVAVQKSSTTWPLLGAAASIGVSILGEKHADKIRQLASNDRPGRLVGLDTLVSQTGALFLHEAPIWLECTVEHTYPGGDHDIVVLRVLGLASDFDHRPLVWHRSAFSTLAPLRD